ncbi:MAG: hypothetical protein ACR2FN_01135 [Chitinophagaceae bacterium]
MNLINQIWLKKITIICIFFFISLPFFINAQTTYIPFGDKQYDVLDRLEIKTRDQQLFHSVIKPYSRKASVEQVEMIDSMLNIKSDYANLTKVDKYNIQNLLMDNSEWSKPSDYYLSKHPVFGKNGLYKTKDNLIEINNKNFFLAINPELYFSVGKENNNSNNLYQTSYGINLRGMISHAVGFNFSITNNQERDPQYVNDWIITHSAVPNEGTYNVTYLNNGNIDHVNYVDARGSVAWKVTRHIDMQFGYDKNFIGDGYRSLFLSDFSSSATFFKINTRIWKFNYENLYMELYLPGVTSLTGYSKLPHKYGRFNELSINATKWLNLGVFEGVIFGRPDHYDYSYMVPVLFLRPAESNVGSGDNAVVGFHAKANLAGKFQLYGQFLLDELKVSELVKGTGWWGNKNGIQFGVKYVDAFGLKNTDVQLEINQVRPYTYSHYDSVGDYTHFNQPLAHPLGANFREINAIVNAQPLPRLYLKGQLTYYLQGLDSLAADGHYIDYGANPFLNYDLRPRDYGFKVGDGDKATCTIFTGTVSYELKENMFVEVTAFYRNFKLASLPSSQKTTTINVSFRWNMGRREFIF